jgi:hypothetical protein
MNNPRRNVAAPRQQFPASALLKQPVEVPLPPPESSNAVVTVVDNNYTPHMRLCMLIIGAILCCLIIVSIVLIVENTHKSHKLNQGQLDVVPNILKHSAVLADGNELIQSELSTVIYEFKMTKQVQKWESIPSHNEHIPGIVLESQKIVGYDVCCYEPDEAVWVCTNSPSTLSFFTKLKLVNNDRNLQLMVHALSVKFTDTMCMLKIIFIT